MRTIKHMNNGTDGTISASEKNMSNAMINIKDVGGVVMMVGCVDAKCGLVFIMIVNYD